MMSWRTNPYGVISASGSIPDLPHGQFPPQLPKTPRYPPEMRQAAPGERVAPLSNCPGFGIAEDGDIVKLAPDPPPTAEEIEEYRPLAAHVAAWRGERERLVDEPLRQAIGYRDNPRQVSPVKRRPWWKFWRG